jgi:hypothetical protein
MHTPMGKVPTKNVYKKFRGELHMLVTNDMQVR